MHKGQQNVHKKILLCNKKNEDKNPKVFEFYYIYKEKHKEEKDINKFDYTKLILTFGYLYEFEEDEEQTDEKPDKKEPPKKPTKSDANEFSRPINRKEMHLNRELFQKHFKCLVQR